MTTEAPAPPEVAPRSTARETTPPRGAADAPVACVHCGLPVPDGAAPTDGGLPFCCHGCEAVYAVLHDCGLENYYRLREELDPRNAQDDPGGPPRPDAPPSYAVFDDEAFARQHVTLAAPDRAHIRLRL